VEVTYPGDWADRLVVVFAQSNCHSLSKVALGVV